MFEKLFKRPHTIQRMVSHPLLEERLHFLSHLAEYGAAQSTLQGIARYQLIVIDYLKLQDRETITHAEIEAAAERWAQQQAGSPRLKGSLSPLSKYCFIKYATQWLGFLGRLQKPVLTPLPFAQFVSEFAGFMRDERGLSSATISSRCCVVDAYLAELCGQQLMLSDLTITHIDNALLQHIKQASYTRLTVRNHASILRAFFRYAEQRGWCQYGLANAIKGPRIFRHETLPFSPSWEDVQHLIAGTNGACPSDIRDCAILLLLAVYGLRSGEVRRLQLEDLDWEHELIRIRRVKKGPVQSLPLSHTVGEAILRYLREARPRRSACRELFLTLRAPFRALKSGAICNIVTHRWQPLNVAIEHHGPHSLRHACATRLINQGVSLKEIGEQLGHRDMDTTRIYAKVDLTRLREVADFNLAGVLCN
jgi:integrase/recombinase XerD